MVSDAITDHKEVFVFDRNARLTLHGRRLLVERVATGRSCQRRMGISRATGHQWVNRYREESPARIAEIVDLHASTES
nr:leucine zipper domain-containing protein [Amycolatopsis umgeniensis]